MDRSTPVSRITNLIMGKGSGSQEPTMENDGKITIDP